MVKITPDDAHAVLEVAVSGRLHKDDYEHFVPVLEEFLSKHRRIAVLLLMQDFKGWDVAAGWEDCKVGFRHFTDFRRIALVGESGWQRAMAEFCRVLTPAAVKYFKTSDLEQARQWCRGPDESAVHLRLDDGTGIAHVRVVGKIDPKDFERIAPKIDAFIERHEQVRICLDVQEFDGWDSLLALGDHLAFVFKHQRFASRIAIIGDMAWVRALATVVGAIAHPKTKCFPPGSESEAEQWLLQAGD